jgi:nitrite reductase/ring-hydroxylating ferredoxin subunit
MLKSVMISWFFLSALLVSMLLPKTVSSFTLVMMGARRGKSGNLKRALQDQPPSVATTGKKSKKKNTNPWQEITGVTLPAPRTIKGWEFGNNLRLACTNVDGNFYALQGDCPRCAFDLWKGDLLTDAEVWGKDAVPCVACPTCATTYSFRTGRYGPPMQRRGLAGFVGNLAKTATEMDAKKNARAFEIKRDPDDGRVYCREQASSS